MPSGAAPLFLACSDGGCAPADAQKSGAKCVAGDECGGSAGGASGAVIEGRDCDVSALAQRQLRGGSKQDHRIESATHGKYRAFAHGKRSLDCALYLGSFNVDPCHDSFNLPIHGGFPLGDARSAGNAVGIAWPDCVLHRANLAEYAARLLPDAATYRNSAELVAGLA